MAKKSSMYAIFKEYGKQETFVCDRCQRVLPKGWSDDDALDEMRARFPGVDYGECYVVCDDCVDKIEIKPEYDIDW
jgi:hypothetical protein